MFSQAPAVHAAFPWGQLCLVSCSSFFWKHAPEPYSELADTELIPCVSCHVPRFMTYTRKRCHPSQSSSQRRVAEGLGEVMCGLSRSLCLSLCFAPPCHAHSCSLCVFMAIGTPSCCVFASQLAKCSTNNSQKLCCCKNSKLLQRFDLFCF